MHRRLISVLALLALLAAPAAPLVAAASDTGCCGSRDCCASGLCPMRAHRTAAKVEQEKSTERLCHHAASTQAAPKSADPKCSLRGGCAPERGTASVLASEAPAVVTAVARVASPELARKIPVGSFFSPASGFFSVPFLPPR
jgi:hypothetical protein